jgi:ribosomal-protein-alanine N-acetyltransferase
VEFRRALPSDLDSILAIERASFTIPWTEAVILPELADDGRHLPLLASIDGEAVGFALVWVIADEMHLVNFAVEPARRRRGIGRALLTEVLDRARQRDISMVTLEVRETNEAARVLYRDFGFVEVALRPGYYPDTREDAVIMLLQLDSGPA